MTPQRRKLTEPLESVVAFFGSLMLIALLGGIVLTAFGGTFAGTVCVTQPYTTYGSSNWTMSGFGIHARPGNSLDVNGTLQACADHPGLGQRLLDSLTVLPTALLWAGVLLLLWQIIAIARRDGPFTPRVAVGMRRLGWFILVGALVAAIVREFAVDELLVTMSNAPNPFTSLVVAPLRGLPVPALTGAALLTFSRIVRLGAEMDEEIKGTV